MNLEIEPTLEQRKVIYRARRGLKELDIYFDPYVRHHYLTADPAEQQVFASLIEQEDPDLLDWFMAVTPAPSQAMSDLIIKMKKITHEMN